MNISKVINKLKTLINKNKYKKNNRYILEKKIKYSIENNTMEYVIAKQYEKAMHQNLQRNNVVFQQQQVYNRNNMYNAYCDNSYMNFNQVIPIQYNQYQNGYYNKKMDIYGFCSIPSNYYNICSNCGLTTSNMFCERCGKRLY